MTPNHYRKPTDRSPLRDARPEHRIDKVQALAWVILAGVVLLLVYQIHR